MKRGLLVFVLLAVLICSVGVYADEPGFIKKLWWKITGPPEPCGERGMYGDVSKCAENCPAQECVATVDEKCYFCKDAKAVPPPCPSGLFSDAGSCEHECEGECRGVWQADRRCFGCLGKRLSPDPTASPLPQDALARSCSQAGLYETKELCNEYCAGEACSGVHANGLDCFWCPNRPKVKQCDAGLFSTAAACNYACAGECKSIFRSDLRCWGCTGILVGPVPPPPFVDDFTEKPAPVVPKETPPAGGGYVNATGAQIDVGPEGGESVGPFGPGETPIGGDGPTESGPVVAKKGCSECDPILKELNIALADLAKAQKAVADQQAKIGELQDALDKAEKALDDAKKALDNFENPKSWVESEGRRLDSSDLAAIREANAAAYARYKNGEMSAQELQDYWGKLPAGEQEKYKKIVHDKLKKKVDDAQSAVDGAEVAVGDARTELDNLRGDVAVAQKDVDALRKSYEECLKRCHAGEEERGVVEEEGREGEEPGTVYSQDPNEVPPAGKDEGESGGSYVTRPELPKGEVFKPKEKEEGGVLDWLMDWFRGRDDGKPSEQITETVDTDEEEPSGPRGPREESPTFVNACEKDGFFADKADCSCKQGESCVSFKYAEGSLGAVSCYRCVPAGSCSKFGGSFGFDSNAECETNCKPPKECLGRTLGEIGAPGLPKGFERKVCYGCQSVDGGEEEQPEGGGEETGGGVGEGGETGGEPGPTDGPFAGTGCEVRGLLSDEFECKSCKADEECKGLTIREDGKPSIKCFQCQPKRLDCSKGGGFFNSKADCERLCSKPGVFCHFMPSFGFKDLGCWQCLSEGYRPLQEIACGKFASPPQNQDYNSCLASCPGARAKPATAYCKGEDITVLGGSKMTPDEKEYLKSVRCYKCVPLPTPTGGGGVTETPPKGQVSCENVRAKVPLFSKASSCQQSCRNGVCKGANVQIKDLGKTLVCFACVPVEPAETHTTVPVQESFPTQMPTQPQVTERVCSCPEGTSTSQPDPNQILASLNQYRCVSGASINVKGTRQGDCPPCYGQPQISVNSQPPVCQTPCGPVACDSSATCPCPDKPNCQLTASCKWGGWKQAGQNQFVPVVG